MPTGRFGIGRGIARLFNLVFPGDCKVCGERLENASRIPVCPSCLDQPQPLVAEHACWQCRTPFLNDFPLRPDGRCALCRAGLTKFQSAYSYGGYDGPLAKLIHLYKYAKIRTLSRPLGALLSRGFPRHERVDVIVPVPLHWWKRIQRGFNQSQLLCQELSRRTGIPVSLALVRRRSTQVQAGLTNAQRRKNVAAAFAAWPGAPVEGKRVLLVDDVMTTGATVSAAADALIRAGACRVTVLTLARVDRRAPALILSKSLKSQFAASGAS